MQDQGHRQVEPAAAVEPQVPGRDPVAVGASERFEPELVQPALDLRAEPEFGLARFG